jgi:hypothetical protein
MVERNGTRILARLEAEGWTRLEGRTKHILLERNGRRLLLAEGDWVYADGTAHAIAMAAGWIAAEG